MTTLSLTTAPVTVDFDLNRPVLKVAQADGGGEGGGDDAEAGEEGEEGEDDASPEADSTNTFVFGTGAPNN